jgi:hypothetical protein
MPLSKHYQTHLSPAAEEALEQVDIKKLLTVVQDSLETISNVTKLPLQEVMHIIEAVDVAQLLQATHDAVKKISNATDLDSRVITKIFKENRAATIDHIVHRLRQESHVHRATF